MKLTDAQREFLLELAFENTPPEEAWRMRDNWCPPFPLAVIDAAKRKGLIETKGDRHSDDFAYRFTEAGRLALASGSEKP
jgi:hypothetical protein